MIGYLEQEQLDKLEMYQFLLLEIPFWPRQYPYRPKFDQTRTSLLYRHLVNTQSMTERMQHSQHQPSFERLQRHSEV